MSRGRGRAGMPAATLVTMAVLVAGCGAGGGAAPPDSAAGTDSTQGPSAPTSVATSIPTTTTTAPPSPPLDAAGHRALTPQDPLRVLVLGDSEMYDASAAIKAALESTGVATVTEGAVFGFGLNEENPADWRAYFPRVLAESQSELVIMMLGSWDHLYVNRYGVDTYAATVEEATNALLSTGAQVLWLGEPPNDPARGTVGLREQVNEVYASLPAAHPGQVAYLDLTPVLTDESGQFTDILPGLAGPERIRKATGNHFCPAGAQRVADLVTTTVTPVWALPAPAADWSFGAWRGDARYDNPAGSCPPI